MYWIIILWHSYARCADYPFSDHCYGVNKRVAPWISKLVIFDRFGDFRVFELPSPCLVPVLLGLTDIDEDLPNSSWVCWGGILDQAPTLGGLKCISQGSNNLLNKLCVGPFTLSISYQFNLAIWQFSNHRFFPYLQDKISSDKNCAVV